MTIRLVLELSDDNLDYYHLFDPTTNRRLPQVKLFRDGSNAPPALADRLHHLGLVLTRKMRAASGDLSRAEHRVQQLNAVA